MRSRLRRFAHFARTLVSGCVAPLGNLWDVPPPNQPRTPTHSVRVEQELWDAVKRKAIDRGETITDVIIRALKAYLRD